MKSKFRIQFILVFLIFSIGFLSGCAGGVSASPTKTPLPTPTSTPVVEMTEGIKNTEEIDTARIFILDKQRSVISYSVDETFLNQNNRLATAVGKTSAISGEIQIDTQNLSNVTFGEFIVDISTLKSDSSRRDAAIQNRWLESEKFPLARFMVKDVKGLPQNPKENELVNFQLVGDLTIREVTRSVTWDVSAMLRGKELTGKATTFIYMADWGIEPPNIAGVLIVKDGVSLTLEFVFTEQ
ncbi:MAG: YceI family protein [Anaerolinea sp.]